MPTTPPNDRLVVGKIVAVFGIKGWVKLKSYTQPAENILAYAPWWAMKPKGLPGSLGSARSDETAARLLECAASNNRPQGLVVQLKGIDDRDHAQELVGCELSVAVDCLPPLAGDDFYWHQLVGLKVISGFAGKQHVLGRVTGLLETGANDVLVVKAKAVTEDEGIDQRERLVPFVYGLYVTAVDLEQGVITVAWDPEF